MTLELECRRTALVMIDLQHWILGRPLAPHPADQVVANAQRLAGAVRAGGGLVVLVRVAFSPGYGDLLQQPVDMPLTLPEGGIPKPRWPSIPISPPPAAIL